MESCRSYLVLHKHYMLLYVVGLLTQLHAKTLFLKKSHSYGIEHDIEKPSWYLNRNFPILKSIHSSGWCHTWYRRRVIISLTQPVNYNNNMKSKYAQWHNGGMNVRGVLSAFLLDLKFILCNRIYSRQYK